VTASDNGQIISINLNGNAIAALNAAIGNQIALGGAITSLTGTAGQYVFGYSDANLTRQLVLTLADAADWYSVSVSSLSQILSFSTATPGDGPAGFGNALKPHLEIYGPGGNLVASGTTLSDGRNESIRYRPLMTGGYRIRVVAQGQTSGEYLLVAPDTIPPAIVSADLSFQTQQNVMSVKFSEDVSQTIELADMAIHSLPSGPAFYPVAVAYEAASNTARFSLPAALADGTYCACIGAGAVCDRCGNALGSDYEYEFFSLLADANHDGTVNTADFAAMADHFNSTGTSYCDGDFNYDGSVNALDFNALATQFGKQIDAVSAASAMGSIGTVALARANPPSLFSAVALRFDDEFILDRNKRDVFDLRMAQT
jgi:hypothetical protein